VLDAKQSMSSPSLDCDLASPSRTGSSVSSIAFRLTVIRHYRTVYRMAAALLNDAAEAEDVTQEAFTRYWQNGERVEKPNHWLLRVARNLCLDRLRKSGRELDGHDLEATADHRAPDWHYENSELSRALEEHISALPEPQRSLIVLFDVRGFNGADCAAILGLNENQVKVYLHRARRRLRLKLEQHDG